MSEDKNFERILDFSERGIEAWSKATHKIADLDKTLEQVEVLMREHCNNSILRQKEHEEIIKELGYTNNKLKEISNKIDEKTEIILQRIDEKYEFLSKKIDEKIDTDKKITMWVKIVGIVLTLITSGFGALLLILK